MRAIILLLLCCTTAYAGDYDVPDYLVREQVDTARLCGSMDACTVYSEGLCVIAMSPIAERSIVLPRERMMCILRHNGHDGTLMNMVFPARL